MFIPYTNFFDFEPFKEAALNWDLDMRLLSRNDFKSCLCLFHHEHVQIARLFLNGKIEQRGINPPGFRSLIVPASINSSFSWLHKRAEGNQILFFPKDGTLDAVSFKKFDVYVVSIQEDYLMRQIALLNFKNCENHFKSEANQVVPQQRFLIEFRNKVEELFQVMVHEYNNEVAKNALVNELIYLLLYELEMSTKLFVKNPHQKRDLGVKKVTEYINQNTEEILSIPQLCQFAGISQRSLEYGFKDKYEVTPKQYLKYIKLNKIRAELIQNKQMSTSNIAAKYGFWHLGQFAKDFRMHFGVLPSSLAKNKMD